MSVTVRGINVDIKISVSASDSFMWLVAIYKSFTNLLTYLKTWDSYARKGHETAQFTQFAAYFHFPGNTEGISLQACRHSCSQSRIYLGWVHPGLGRVGILQLFRGLGRAFFLGWLRFD